MAHDLCGRVLDSLPLLSASVEVRDSVSKCLREACNHCLVVTRKVVQLDCLKHTVVILRACRAARASMCRRVSCSCRSGAPCSMMPLCGIVKRWIDVA